MGTPAAPRIDDRLRRFIAGSHESAAEVTRLTGALAEDLGLARPSYQQVRVLLRVAQSTGRPIITQQRAKQALDLFGRLYEYPGPGLADWYERYKRGA